MAEIVETLLDTTTDVSNFNAIYTWLVSNISGYFDTIEKDDNVEHGTIYLKIGGVTKLRLANPTATDGFAADIYSTTIAHTTVNSLKLIDKAYKTDYGFCLINSSNNRAIFVSKDSNNDTFILGFGVNDSIHKIVFTSSTSERVFYAHWNFGIKYLMIYRWNQLYNGQNLTTGITQKTMLEPLMTYEGSYTPNLFLTPYSQYTGTVGIITIDGTDYVYNGYCALKG